jgi:hypothetical protein
VGAAPNLLFSQPRETLPGSGPPQNRFGHGVWDLAAKEVHDQSEDNTDEDTGSQGKVKADVAAFEADVPGQPAQPGELGGQQEDRPQDYQDNAYDDQQSAQFRHGLVTPTFPFRREAAAIDSEAGGGDVPRTFLLLLGKPGEFSRGIPSRVNYPAPAIGRGKYFRLKYLDYADYSGH